VKKTNPLVFAVLATLMFANLSGCLSQSTEETSEDDALRLMAKTKPTLTTHCAEIADVERCWMLLVPEQLEADKAVPMVLDLHGGGGTNSLQYNMSGFAQLAEEQGFIVAYPQAHGERNWDIDIDGLRNDYDDMGYLMRIINVTSEEHLVDTNRLYMTGWSNGCMMTQRFAVETQSVLASAGCMSGYLMKEAPATYSAPIPFMEVHGMLDPIVQYVDNTAITTIAIGNPGAGFNRGAVQNMEYWADLNECSGAVHEVLEVGQNYDIRGYEECEAGAEVRLMSLHLAGHNAYQSGTPNGIPTTQVLWEFLSQFSIE